MKSLAFLCLMMPFNINFEQRRPGNISTSIIAKGQMPNLAIDKSGNAHLVYGTGENIMYEQSNDGGKTFSMPSLVSKLPGLSAAAMRGPQIACTLEGLTILAANVSGNIYSYRKDGGGHWIEGARVNDIDAIAKEGLMALSGDGETLFAVWLDLRGNMRNKIVGAKSTDAGKTWSKNVLIYASPDSSVCECCKPSVAVKGNKVFIMFRNSLHGNRDLYLIGSTDEGNHFGNAEKLGNGSWPLNGCPMDGGGIVISTRNIPQTVWRRQGKIFACEPGKPEIEIGGGSGCSIESVNGKIVYAWTENGEVVCVLPQGRKQHLGKGALPIIKAVNNEHIICIWENEKQVHKAVLGL
ncbi:MAG TPA: sialidase family protein [Puia sp.]|jgi:hypothetical protein|nr:sialidase family protein [Puia sp.]